MRSCVALSALFFVFRTKIAIKLILINSHCYLFDTSPTNLGLFTKLSPRMLIKTHGGTLINFQVPGHVFSYMQELK